MGPTSFARSVFDRYVVMRCMTSARHAYLQVYLLALSYILATFQCECCQQNITAILCLWFRASLIYINNCPTRFNTNQSIYFSASSLYMFRVSTTPIIRSTQNCNYSLRYCAATYLQRDQASLAALEGGSCTKNAE